MIAIHRNRGLQILDLLKEHQILSLSTINLLLRPIQKPRLTKRSLGILLRKGLLVRSKIARQKYFYRLSKTASARSEIAKLLNCKEDSLGQTESRVANPVHHEIVELWIGKLKELQPSAQIFRESEILKSTEARSIIGWKHSDEALALPDFMAKIKSEAPGRFAWIAFEIELHRKSRGRISTKLLKYGGSSSVVGLVYISDIDVVINQVDDVFRVVQKKCEQRIGHFADNFLLFSTSDINGKFSESKMVSYSGKAISLANWVNVLRSKSVREIRNSDFDLVAPRGHLNSGEKPEAELKDAQGFQ
jgi:hypothetical protein